MSLVSAVVSPPQAPHDIGPNKRRRVTRACDACKAKRKRCTGEQPCQSCDRVGIECLFLSSYTRGRPPSPPKTHSNGRRTLSVEGSRAYSPATSHLVNFPTSIESARPSRGGSPVEAASTQLAGHYHGPSSAHSFLRRAWRRIDQHVGDVSNSIAPDDTNDQESSIFTHGDRPLRAERQHRKLSRSETRVLYARYFDYAMPTYRFLHQGRVGEWLEIYHQEEEGAIDSTLPAGKRAIVLLVLATAAIWEVDEHGAQLHDPYSDQVAVADALFKTATDVLQIERGRTQCESIQARFAAVLYLLNTSRPNQAWFTFGTTTQLLIAMGLHRKVAPAPTSSVDEINIECQKRLFWSCYTLDYYLSVMLGRPRMFRDEDVDQEYPREINDEDLMQDRAPSKSKRRDCLMVAPIAHAKLARIVARVTREQYALRQSSFVDRVEVTRSCTADIESWRNALPPFLSGAVHLSSLILLLRRQATVLQLARSHAMILVSRPFLLYKTGFYIDVSSDIVSSCIRAAADVVRIILELMEDGQVFPFWYTQYIAFSALTVIYVFIIQRKFERIGAVEHVNEVTLFAGAKQTQQYLAAATEVNAPSMRYAIILDELQQHAQGAVDSPDQMPIEDGAAMDTLLQDDLSPFSLASGFPHALDFWPQLDSLPFANFHKL